MRVALVHDWLVAHRGGEAVLLELARMFPGAVIYTLVADADRIHPELIAHDIRTSFIQTLPGSPGAFRQYLPLFPAAIESFDLSSFDLIISTSHCVAKGAQSGSVFHLSYIHTPMRYAWEVRKNYAPSGLFGSLARPAFEIGAAGLRNWDRKSASRPDALVANSKYVAERIEHSWGRSAEVIHPPVDTAFFTPNDAERSDYYAVVGAQVGYKNNGLAIEMANQTGIQLKVVGSGPAIDRAKVDAAPNVTFEGQVSRERLRDIYREARGLLFCGVEDFGIVPVEAISCGCPVVAFGEGGALETVSESPRRATGTFFYANQIDALRSAIDNLERHRQDGRYDPQIMHAHASQFSPDVFRAGILDSLQKHGIYVDSK